MGVLVGVADCGKSWKWVCRGRSALGFKTRRSSHVGQNHAVLGLPKSRLGKQNVASTQSSLLAVWKNAEETLQVGKG